MPYKAPRHHPFPPRPRADRRGSSTSRGYDYRHQQQRKTELQDQPLCVLCFQRGLIIAATQIDHIIPLAEGGDPHDPDNRRPLCAPCNARKGATSDKKRIKKPKLK